MFVPSSSQRKNLSYNPLMIRAQKPPLIAFSPKYQREMQAIKKFSREYIYRHPKILSQMSRRLPSKRLKNYLIILCMILQEFRRFYRRTMMIT
jgi:hypothetical protein